MGGSNDAESEDLSRSPPAIQKSGADTGSDRVYQCSHCTYITTDLHNVRIHVVAEHAASDGGFAEIKTAVGSDGNVIMKVNDRVLGRKDRESVKTAPVAVNMDKDGKVYTVL